MTDELGSAVDKRLRSELDRFNGPTPLPEHARFNVPRSRYRRLGAMRPALAVAGALAVLMVAASVASGSPSPIVWTQRAVTTVELVTHIGEPSPSPEGSPREQLQPAAQPEPSGKTAPAPESPEPSGGAQPEPSESPEASHTPATQPSPSQSP